MKSPVPYPGRRLRCLLLAAGLLVTAGAQPAPLPTFLSEEEQADRAARLVLARWLEAMGGADEVRELRTAFIKCTIDHGGGTPPVELLVRSDQGRYRMEYQTPAFGQLVQAFDGMVSWQANEQLGFGFLSPLEQQINRIMTDFRAPLRVPQLYPRRRPLPDETIAGRRLRVVQLGTADGREEKWYFDAETGLRVRVDLPGPAGPVVVEFDDFRQGFGARVREPFRTVRIEGGRRTEVKLQLVLYNEPMDAGLFSPPFGVVEENRAIESLLNRHAFLHGGAVLPSVTTRVTEQRVQVTTSGLEVPTRVYQKRPNLVAMVQEVPGMGQVWQGYDGKVGWAWSEIEGYREMQGAELQQVMGSASLEGPLQLRWLCPLRKMLGERIHDGRLLTGIAMASLRGPEGNFYFDPKTDELVLVETFLQAGARGQLKVTAEFGDYRLVDGIRLPHRMTVTNPAMHVVTTVLGVKHNEPLDDKVFAPRKE